MGFVGTGKNLECSEKERRRFPGKENDKVVVPSYSAQEAMNCSCCLDGIWWLLWWITTSGEYVLLHSHFSFPVYSFPLLNLKHPSGHSREGVANPYSHKEVQSRGN